MEQLFFSKENFGIIYNILRNKLNTTSNYDINSNPKFKDELINIVKTIYKQRNTFNVPSNTSDADLSRYLSQKVINVSINYFTETIKKSGQNQMSRDINNAPNTNNINQIDNRPQATSQFTNGKSNVMSNYNKLLNERDNQPKAMPAPINFKDNLNASNNDIKNKYSELSSQRQSDYESIAKSSSHNQQNVVQNTQDFMQNTLPQQNLLSNPSSAQIQHLMAQQKEIQEKLNQFQKQDNNVNFSYNHPSQISMSDSNQKKLFMESTQVNFNPTTQQNPQFNSENNDKLNNILNNQFTSLTEENDSSISGNDMEPDQNINYNDLIQDINGSTSTVNDQFNTITDVSDKQFPTKPFSDETQDDSIKLVTETPNLELDVIKDSINKQSTAINNTNNNIDKLLQLYQENDISKYYETILDIPRLIKEQNTKSLTIKTHNLIVSSRDRNLSNNDFDKYNFRIVFGAESSQTVSQIENNTDNSINNDMESAKQSAPVVFKSSGLDNPSVSQVLKNVISIKLRRVIIPKPREEFNFPEPYFFVAVDEFNSNIISTKNFNEKIFCKIHFDKQLVYNEGTEEGRTYLYYKNDDDDFTIFYSSPLAKLDRLTLKLLDSEGNNVKDSAMKDTDIDTPTIQNSKYIINEKMYANTYKKDKLCVIKTDAQNKVRVTNINVINDGDNKSYELETDTNNPENGDKIINLTNQIEYVFEIKTQEYDPMNTVRPTIDS